MHYKKKTITKNKLPRYAHEKHPGPWQEWMGYVVHYIRDGEIYIEPNTSYGVPWSAALGTMKKILKDGQCAWISQAEHVEEIPF